jgi:hypothetical protein
LRLGSGRALGGLRRGFPEQAFGVQAGAEEHQSTDHADAAAGRRQPIGRREGQEAGQGAEHDRAGKPVEDGERNGRENGRDAMRRQREATGGDGIEAGRGAAGGEEDREIQFVAIGLRRPLQEIGADQPRQQADEQPPLARVARVGIDEVGKDGAARIEVVAVLLAADAGRAVAVRHDDQRRLPISALDRSERAEGAAPAAAPGEDQTADESQDEDADDAGGDQTA